MRFACKTKIEKAWLVASVLIFLAHLILEASSQSYDADIIPLLQSLELWMVALSFPLGAVSALVLQDAMFWCDGCRDLVFMLGWPTVLFVGYVQWFWVLPEFFRNRKLTLLDLGRTPETTSPDASPAHAEPAMPTAFTPASPVDFAAATALPAFDASAYAPLFAEFDAAGLTALDRVFQAQRPAAARGEAIFRERVEAGEESAG